MGVQRFDSRRSRFAAANASPEAARRSRTVSISTLISAARYWPDERALELCLAGGRRYLYLGVPETLADAFTHSPSKGRFFNEAIKGRFPCHELASEPASRRRRAAND